MRVLAPLLRCGALALHCFCHNHTAVKPIFSPRQPFLSHKHFHLTERIHLSILSDCPSLFPSPMGNSRSMAETLKLSNNALCNLSTSITDLNNIMAQADPGNPSHAQEDDMMHRTNIALVELSNRLTGLIGKHFQSKGEGNQDSLFEGMDELLKRISFINRKSVRKIKVERERKEYYRKKVRRMRQKFILKRTLLPSASAIFPITQKSIEKKIARNEIKPKYAMRRYHTVSERNAQDIAGTLALCGEFFQPCFKQMILWLVTYYRSVAGAFDELGSCLENDGDGKSRKASVARLHLRR